MTAKVHEIPVLDVRPGMVLAPEEYCVNAQATPAFAGKDMVVTGMISDRTEFLGDPTRRISFTSSDGTQYGTFYPKVPTVRVMNRPSVLRKMDVHPASMISNISTLAGADPEVFVTHADGTLIPAWEYLPSKVEAVKLGRSAYYDGFQAEFTTAPVHCHGFFTDYTRQGLAAVWAAARVKFPDAKLSIASALPTLKEELMKYDNEHVALGCSSSRNVYGEEPLAVPDTYELEWRFAGCHQHYGSMGLRPEVVVGAVRMLDAVVGVANVSLAGPYLCRERRRWYGRAGEFRYHEYTGTVDQDAFTKAQKMHRLEYRVPDTVVMCHPAIYNLFVDVARLVCKMGAGGLGFLWQAEEDEVRVAVNEGDVGLARKILVRNQTVLTRILQRAYGCYGLVGSVYDVTDARVVVGLRTLLEGVESVVGNPEDVVGNWSLAGMWDSEGYRSITNTPTGKWWHSAALLAAQGLKV